MVDTLQTILRDAGDAIYDVFIWPGNFVFLQLSTLAPEFAAKLSTLGNDTYLIFTFSMIHWILVYLMTRRIIRLLVDTGRNITETIRVMALRIELEMRNLKIGLVRTVRSRQSVKNSICGDDTATIEFDELEFAILKYAIAKGQVFTLSAPELGEHFLLRPAQVQRNLDKLRTNKMLDYAIGSTDGYDNYRLTNSGAAFVAIWERQQMSV